MYFELSKKSRYAILALYELALRSPDSPLNARKLALHNNLPVRFLEVILNELKQGGFVMSVRGKAGGYVLARSAKAITLSQLLNYLEARPSASSEVSAAAMPGHYVADLLVKRANAAVAGILDGCSLEDMVQQEMAHRSAFESNYVI